MENEVPMVSQLPRLAQEATPTPLVGPTTLQILATPLRTPLIRGQSKTFPLPEKSCTTPG